MNGLLALAFAAGMLAPVNPCGFALLPAWIIHTLGDADTSVLPVRLGRALRAGVALTLGFTATLALAGLAISAGARALISAAPWLGLVTGLALLLLGVAVLAGRSLRLPTRLSPSSRPLEGPPSVRRLAAFGVAYAAASLSCTLGVLLAVIAQAQATSSYAGMLAVFAAYGAGSAAVLLLVAVTTAAAGSALTRKITALARHGTRITAIVLVLTGAYLVWYWYPAASGSTGSTGSSLGLKGFSVAASTSIQAHTTTIAILATIVVLTVTAAAMRHRHRQGLPNAVEFPRGSSTGRGSATASPVLIDPVPAAADSSPDLVP